MIEVKPVAYRYRWVDDDGELLATEYDTFNRESDCDEVAALYDQSAIDALQARIAELEKDARRLGYLLTKIEGFMLVKKDRHEFACDVALERGHDEPTREDELIGFRRLIDAAIAKENSDG